MSGDSNGHSKTPQSPSFAYRKVRDKAWLPTRVRDLYVGSEHILQRPVSANQTITMLDAVKLTHMGVWGAQL